MNAGSPRPFGSHLRELREAAGFTQEELATIAGISVHAVSALERGRRNRPHPETVRALSAALDLMGPHRAALLESARTPTAGVSVTGQPDFAPLPVPPTPLLGRDTDLATVCQWLADPATRLITLVGPGGVGKTRLALEVARAISNDGGMRVLLTPLAATRNPAFVASQIAETLELPDVPPGELPARVRAALDGRSALLVLDNFEHVLEAAPLVADLLTSVASLRLLVTSRAPLHVRGEREYAVGPLALDVCMSTASPADLARCPAVRLFLERVRDVRPGFRLTAANGPTVAAICRRLDALPLAIELAAPWIKVLSTDELLHRLSENVLLPTVGLRDLPERQQTMNATVAWSYQLLHANEQCAFRRLSVLPGRFPIEAAAAVISCRGPVPDGTDEALSATGSLIDKSLLMRTETTVRSRPLYQMLETVRTFALGELMASGDRDVAMDGLARYCIGAASHARTGLVGASQIEFLDRVRDDLESHRSALAWLIDRGRGAEAASIAWGLMFYWLIRGHAVEGLDWCEQILRLPSLPPAAELRVLAGTLQMRYIRGELDLARTVVARASELDPSAADAEAVGLIEILTGHLEHLSGNRDAARAQFMESLARFRAAEIPWGVNSALIGLSSVALADRDIAHAERLVHEATSVRRLGPWFKMPGLYLRAILAVRGGRPDEAIALLQENLDGMRALHDRCAFVYALVPLAAASVLKHDDVSAARVLGARDALIERTGVTVADHPVRDLREQATLEARARLGADRWAEEYAAGRRISIESAQDLYRFVTESQYALSR